MKLRDEVSGNFEREFHGNFQRKFPWKLPIYTRYYLRQEIQDIPYISFISFMMKRDNQKQGLKQSQTHFYTPGQTHRQTQRELDTHTHPLRPLTSTHRVTSG